MAWFHNGRASFESMRRQAVSELQTKPAVHCTDPAAPRASPRRSPKFNRSFPAVCFDSNTAANDKRGSVWPRCSVRWRVGLLQALRRKSTCTVNAASVEPAGREEQCYSATRPAAVNPACFDVKSNAGNPAGHVYRRVAQAGCRALVSRFERISRILAD